MPPITCHRATHGALHGYAIDIAAAALKNAEIKHVFIATPYPRAFEVPRACDELTVGVFKSPEREAFLAFSEPIAADHVTLVTRTKNPFVYFMPKDLSGESLTDLSGAFFASICACSRRRIWSNGHRLKSC